MTHLPCAGASWAPKADGRLRLVAFVPEEDRDRRLCFVFRHGRRL